ncbi:MAG: DNA polymerase III subunit gamma/tau [Kiritimatiellia bacterium]|jgi:DNA polymerase-3 subunit gamma/tau
MAYEVIARKWRPQQFEDVVGQSHVITTLQNAITSERVAHAYLFVGPRGVGKTTIARIFARALNCVKGPAVRACGECDSCLEIAAGINLDVQEIDAASNRGIDNIRELRDNARFMPRGRFKIYIIDEVHMLTNEAFNALLKTLEEPPPHLKFFMATTDPERMPATILSRCQRFDLRRIPIPLIVERLALIAKAENVAVDQDALNALARAAEGGLRDAESALDQMISFQGREIKEADVLSVFGLISHNVLETLSGSILSGDILQTVKLIGELDEQGKDMQRLLVELLEHFRNLLIYVEVGAAAAGELIDSDTALLAEQAQQAEAGRLLRMTEILMDTLDRMRYALSQRTLVETALIRCARLRDSVSLDEVLAQIQTLRRQLPAGAGGVAVPAAAPVRPVVTASTRPAPAAAPATERRATAASPAAPAQTTATVGELKLKPPSAANDLPTGEHQRLLREWPSIVERVGRAAIRARTYLLSAAPLSVQGDKVVIGVDREFADRQEQLEQPRNRTAIQKSVSEVLRRPVDVVFELCDQLPDLGIAPTGKSAPQPNAAGRKVKAASAPSAGEAPQKASDAGKSSMHKWMADEKVQKVLDTFNGSIQEIRE